MAVTKTARLVIAGVAVVVTIAVALVILNRGNKETTVYLTNDGQGRCIVQSKELSVTIKKDKQMTWVVNDENCNFKEEVVTVGNFRLQEINITEHCRQAVMGTGVIWPFKEDQNDLSTRQDKSKIKLHVKKDADLPGDRLTYYYDICTGVEADKKSDPLLVIEK